MDSRSAARIKPGLRHKRQVFWQILLPVILAALAGIALVVLLSISTANGSTAASQWSSIATIWLILPLMVFGGFFALTLTGLIYLISRLRRKLPTYTHLVDTYIQIFNIRVGILFDQAARPQISALGRWAGWRTFWKRLWHVGK